MRKRMALTLLSLAILTFTVLSGIVLTGKISEAELVSTCNTNSYMLYPWAGGRNHAQELPCAKVLGERS